MWQKDATNTFKVDTIESDLMKIARDNWMRIYQGKPPWADKGIRAFNFAKKLCNETARLTTLALGITVEGSARADWINGFMRDYISHMQTDAVEKACAFGEIILKPNGNGIDYVLPWNFLPTHEENGVVNGGIFFDHYHNTEKNRYYTRLEWQRFEETEGMRIYCITNRTFCSDREDVIGRECRMKDTVWADLEEDAAYEKIEKPLFSVFKMPIANNIDLGSASGMSFFSNAMQELESLDVAWTRLYDEAYDSQKITFLGDILIDEPGQPVRSQYAAGAKDKAGRELPRYVRIIPGSSVGDEYHETTVSMVTDQRIQGINHWLNMVGVKCGYSTGQFVLDGRTGAVTATQVEADDRETIQTIKQIRDALQSATDGLLYALDKWADIYDLAPVGVYETNYDFGDITYSFEEDKARHWQYVQSGKYPLYRYYMEFEGMSEEEAKAVTAEAQKKNGGEKGLFGEE